MTYEREANAIEALLVETVRRGFQGEPRDAGAREVF